MIGIDKEAKEQKADQRVEGEEEERGGASGFGGGRSTKGFSLTVIERPSPMICPTNAP